MPLVAASLACIVLSRAGGLTGGFVDEGALLLGGSPRLASGKATIRLVRQKIGIQVSDGSVDVDATFDLKNTGLAGYFRVAFPEMGRGFSEIVRRDRVEMARRQGVRLGPFQAFVYFSLFVDGRAAEVSVERGEPSVTFRTKLVRFYTGQIHHLRISYRVPIGRGATSSGGELLQTGFDLAPSAGWQGSVGETEVLVQIRNPRVKGPLTAVSIESLRLKSPFDSKSLAAAPSSNLYYRAFAKPERVSANTLRFFRKDFDPVPHHGLRLYFGYRPNR